MFLFFPYFFAGRGEDFLFKSLSGNKGNTNIRVQIYRGRKLGRDGRGRGFIFTSLTVGRKGC